jgi:CDP-diacylglycerol--glycerol-3-phosphate 3-phosphatidyltransferase
MIKNIPNILTIFRILIIPVLIFSFYIPGVIANVVVASLFLLASFTDFFDGYLARAMKVQSNFGKCLDPIADKLLVAAAIIMLIHFSGRNLAITIPGIIIISREILVSGLREFLATINVSVPVSNLGKYKTAIQMISITLLLLGERGSEYALIELFGEDGRQINFMISGTITIIGETLFALSAFLTVVTGYIYLKTGIKNM